MIVDTARVSSGSLEQAFLGALVPRYELVDYCGSCMRNEGKFELALSHGAEQDYDSRTIHPAGSSNSQPHRNRSTTST